jgi:DNA repair photolyase
MGIGSHKTKTTMKKNIKTHHGLVIYQPSGKAAEYSRWAANFYNGCSNGCHYCYDNQGITSRVLGGLKVRLKKSLVDVKTAEQIFLAELAKWRDAIIKDGGLHFNFVSDPCLPETIDLNWTCIDYAISQGVPCQVLTKRADWLDHPSVQNALGHPELLRVGFSLTGCDELEPGASPNEERISAMRELHQAGIPTWASIEPIIDPQKSLQMIRLSLDCCDHYKIGVLSGKKSYTPDQIRQFVNEVNSLNPRSVYWKDSLLDFIHATRNQMME